MPLQKSGCKVWNGSVFLFGIKSADKKTQFLIYRLSGKLEKTDSLIVDLGKNKPEDYLLINSDTIHNYLNIHLQKKEKKLVQILRFDKKFKLVTQVENVDVARINSIAAFESEIYYYNNAVYTVKASSPDSGDRQFYLNKYTLKSELKNFEYDFTWQFPFEKKNINSAHIVMVNKHFVLLYVNVIGGLKHGQWLLRIDPEKGSLIRGSKLNPKGEGGFYTFGALYHDSISKQLYVLGQKFSDAELSQKDNKISNAGKPHVTVFLTQIDSLIEITGRDEFKIPVIEPKGNKTPFAYLLRVNKFNKTKDGDLEFENDVFKGSHPCYRYCNTLSHTLTTTEEKLTLGKSSVSSNTLIENYYFTSDNADINGKVCCDSLSDFEKLYYKDVPFKVRVGNKYDELNNQVILLHKSDSKKAADNFSVLSTIKKVNQVTKITEVVKAQNPGIFILSKTQYILFQQPDENNVELNVFMW